MTQVLTRKMTREEYLEFDRQSEERYEFVNGELVQCEMPKIIHEIIVGNLIALFAAVLKGSPYRALSSGVKIDIESCGNYRYADVSVVPRENLDLESDILSNAIVLFEVSSKSTVNRDRGEKFDEYQTLPLLQEYVLVSTESIRVEVFRRKARNEWDYIVLEDKSAQLELRSVGATLLLADIYDGTKL